MHRAIIGQTLAGKSHFAKHLARTRMEEVGRRRIVIVLDTSPAAWPCDYRARDFDDLVRVLGMNTNADVFIECEDAEEFAYKADPRAKKMLRAGRHPGHAIHILAQEPKQLDRGLRGSCTWLVAFRLHPELAKDLELSWQVPGIAALVSEHKQGEYTVARPMDGILEARSKLPSL